ncbi:MAG: M12 family metallo-peptidase [Aggregatilineales bacterium]
MAILGTFALLRGVRVLSAEAPPVAPTTRSGVQASQAALVAPDDAFGLQRALEFANQRPSTAEAFRIYLPQGTYTFYAKGEITRAWLPVLTGNVVIYGQNSEIVLSGYGSTSPAQLIVESGASLTLHNVVFRGERNDGRAIINNGRLAVYDSQFYDGARTATQLDSNAGLSGIHNNGELTITRSLLARNQSLSSVEPGGALRNAGKAIITCTRFEENRAERGGAIFNDYGAQLTVTQSAFVRNQANGGGAIFATSHIQADGNWWNGDTPRVEMQNFSADSISAAVHVAEVAEADPTLSAECALQAPVMPPADLLALQNGVGLFIAPAGEPILPSSLNSRATVSRARLVEVDFNAAFAAANSALSGSSFVLNLFEDVTWVAVNDRIEPHVGSPTGFTWIGHIVGKPASEVVLSFDQGTMHGHINLVDQLFGVEYSGSGGLHYVLELNPANFEPCGGGLTPPATTPLPIESTEAVQTEAPPFPPPSDVAGNPIIDVMVVYTSAARSAAGGTQAMLNEINTAVNLTNQSYANTNVNQRIRLVYAAEVAYTEPNNMNTDLNRLTSTNDGFMDEVHVWRNQFKADLVALITNTGQYCGLAWLMTYPNFSNYGFSVTMRSCINNFTFGHELGHNMGSAHNPEDASSAYYSYSYGYRVNNVSVPFRTVMAYNCSSPGCPRINYWSNTALTYYGQPMGTATQNNRLSLNNTASIVADFRTNMLTDTVGIYRPSHSLLLLRNSLSTGPADLTQIFGGADDYPVAGDWDGDGVDTIGVYRRSTGQFLLKNSNAVGAPVVYSLYLGSANDMPIVGDWDGDGKDSVGIFRPSNGLIYIRNTLTTGVADYTLILGVPGDLPVAGDWNGNGRDGIGVFRPSTGTFYLLNNAQQNGTFFADAVFAFGQNGDRPVAGDWNANGIDGVGVYRNGQLSLRNALSSGPPDLIFFFGGTGDLPFTGRFVQP